MSLNNYTGLERKYPKQRYHKENVKCSASQFKGDDIYNFPRTIRIITPKHDNAKYNIRRSTDVVQ